MRLTSSQMAHVGSLVQQRNTEIGHLSLVTRGLITVRLDRDKEISPIGSEKNDLRAVVYRMIADRINKIDYHLRNEGIEVEPVRTYEQWLEYQAEYERMQRDAANHEAERAENDVHMQMMRGRSS